MNMDYALIIFTTFSRMSISKHPTRESAHTHMKTDVETYKRLVEQRKRGGISTKKMSRPVMFHIVSGNGDVEFYDALGGPMGAAEPRNETATFLGVHDEDL